MEAELLNVFTHQGAGGNPCPIVIQANGMSDGDMQSVARAHGHESGFVLPSDKAEFDYRFRYWVPNHEMEMCGHATVGALWLLAKKSLLSKEQVRIDTLSGAVLGFIERTSDGVPVVEITQPAGRVDSVGKEAREAILDVLGLDVSDLLDAPIQNAATSRVKTLVPICSVDRLNSLRPDFSRMEKLCTEIGSTGLYPYAAHSGSDQIFDARQFPRSSGYPEDAATGIAAAALSFGLLSNGLVERSSKLIRVMQGRAMGHLSEIHVRLGLAGERAIGCTVGGTVERA